MNAGRRPGSDASKRLQAPLLGFLRRHQYDGGGAIVDARGVARRDGALLVEGWPQLRRILDLRAFADVLVLRDDGLPFARLDRDRNDLVLEFAGLLGRFGLVLRGSRELVLSLSGDLPLACDVLGGVAHVVAVERLPQAVFDHRVDELDRPHFLSVAKMGNVRGKAHAFLPPSNHDVGIARSNLLRSKRDGPETRAAQLIHAKGSLVHGNAGGNSGLPRRVLSLTC